MVPRREIEYRGTTFTEMDTEAVIARKPAVVLVDELAHTNVPGSKHEKRAAGHRGDPAGRDRRDHHRQHPAPRVPQRRGGADHRRPPAGDGARRGGAHRRPDPAGRHVARGAAPPDGARQHLQAREHRRLADVVLPGRQPDRAARAGPAVAGRPGRRRARRLPARAPDRAHLADQGAHRRRRHRRGGERDADPARRPARPARRRLGAARRARDRHRRAARRRPAAALPGATARRQRRRHVPLGRGRGHPGGRGRLRHRDQRHHDRRRGLPARPAAPARSRVRRATGSPPRRRGGRAPGHPRAGRPLGPVAARRCRRCPARVRSPAGCRRCCSRSR